ncbi:MAG: dUTP diphosphatase [bacterium]
MRVKIQRVDDSLSMPEYKTAGSVCFDLMAREEVVVAPGALARIPLNVIMRIPAGYMLMLVPRSSLPSKKPGLIYPHGVGVIDQDFCGPEDEIQLQVLNIGKESITIARGEAIAQAGFVRIDRADIDEIEIAVAANRGGFGSTDSK